MQCRALLSGVRLSLVCALQGTQIQGTFWRESAEKYLDVLQEGKVRFDQGLTRV